MIHAGLGGTEVQQRVHGLENDLEDASGPSESHQNESNTGDSSNDDENDDGVNNGE